MDISACLHGSSPPHLPTQSVGLGAPYLSGSMRCRRHTNSYPRSQPATIEAGSAIVSQHWGGEKRRTRGVRGKINYLPYTLWTALSRNMFRTSDVASVIGQVSDGH